MNPDNYPAPFAPQNAIDRHVYRPKEGNFLDQRFYMKCEDTDEISDAWTPDPRRFYNLGRVWALMRAIRGTVPGISITVNSVPGINGDGVGFLRDHNRQEIHIVDDTGMSLGLLEIPQIGALLKSQQKRSDVEEVLSQE